MNDHFAGAGASQGDIQLFDCYEFCKLISANHIRTLNVNDELKAVASYELKLSQRAST